MVAETHQLVGRAGALYSDHRDPGYHFLCGFRQEHEQCLADGSLPRVCLVQVIASKGPQHMTRGRQLLQAFQSPNRSLAAAATAASNAAGEPGRKAGA